LLPEAVAETLDASLREKLAASIRTVWVWLNANCFRIMPSKGVILKQDFKLKASQKVLAYENAPARRGSRNSFAPTEEEAKNQDHDRDEQEDLCKAGRKASNAAKAEQRREKCNNSENNGPAKHGALP
jgi:hypothetical protein